MSAVHVLLRVGAEALALPVERVQEVDRIGEVAGVPGAPPGIVGVRTARGRVLPVVDLAGMLDIPAGRPAQMVLAEDGDRRAGLAVDAIVDVLPLQGAPDPDAGRYLTGSVLMGGLLVGVLDLAALFDAIAGP